MVSDMNRKNILQLAIIVCAMIILFVPTVKVYAGDINGEEQRVISAASGTFYYDNEPYRAKDNYIAELRSYLSSDDVDLTADQADAAISEMYSRIEQGVVEGYLYKVESDTTEASTEEITDIEDATEDDTEEDSTEEASDNTTESEEESTQENTSVEIVIDLPSEDKAIGKITYDEDKKIMTYYGQTQKDAIIIPSVDSSVESGQYKNIVTYVLLGISVIICGMTLLLFAAKCFPWQKKKRSRSHNKYYVDHNHRKSIRSIVGTSFVVLLGVHIAISLLLASGYVSLFRNQFVIDHLASSGYYRYLHKEMVEHLSDSIQQYAKEDQKIILDIVSYDQFLHTANVVVQDNLEGQNTVDVESALHDKLVETLATSSLSDEEQAETVTIVADYMKQYTEDVIGSSIYGIRKLVNDILRVNLWIMLFNMIWMTIIVIVMDRYKHRGVRYVGQACVGGSVMVILLIGSLLVWQPFTRIYMEPECLYLFITDYMQRSCIIGVAIGIIGILVGIGLWSLVKVIRQIQMENN